MNDSGARDLCLAAPQQWDEACLLVPAVRALIAAGLRIGIFCPISQAGLWSATGDVVVIPYRPRDWVRSAATKLEGRWKAALCWESGFAADVFTKAAVPTRIGPDGETRLKSRLTRTFPVEPPGPGGHRVRYYLGAIEEMGIPTRNPEFFQPLTEPGQGAGDVRDVLIVADSDFGASHEWSLDGWEAIARKLLERGDRLHVAVNQGKRNIGRQLAARLDSAAQAVELGDVADWIQRLAGFGRVLSVDGTLPHLAALAGAGCAVWFGPNDPVWRRPLGRRHLVIQRHAECAPCFSGVCRMDHRCMRELTPDAAWAELERWLE